MKKFPLLLLSVSLLFTACTYQKKVRSPEEIALTVKENKELLLSCVEEMEKLAEERLYVAYEVPKEKEDEEKNTAEVPVTTEPLPPRLVSFEKESDDRVEIENEILQKAILDLGLELIFYQTASDSRRTVIFSFTRESASGIQNGFYYSYDSLPSGWWGRTADLKQKDKRHLQIAKNGNAWYYTVQIEDSFYYYQKEGALVA